MSFLSLCCFRPLQPKPENAVTIAVSTRVLFRTETEQKIYEQKGIEEYLKYQMEHENEPFAPGPAFPFVKVRDTERPNCEVWCQCAIGVAMISFIQPVAFRVVSY